MTENMRNSLMAVVERVVHPLPTMLARKRRMREELLSHLAAVYEEEAARLGDGDAALARARERFGDPAQVRKELLRTVRPWHRFRYWVEKLRREPDESLPHLLLKHLLAAGLFYGVSAPLTLGPIYGAWWPTSLVASLSAVTAIYSFMFVFLLECFARSLYGVGRSRSRLGAAYYWLWSAHIFPMLVLMIRACLGLPPSGVPPLALGLIALAAPVMFALAGRQAAEGLRHEDEWARIQVGRVAG